MAGYKTGAPELLQAAKNMEDTKQHLMQLMSQMAQKLEPLQGVWKGEASIAFHTLIEHFQSDAKVLNESLDQIATSVAGSAEAYRQQEEEASQSLSAITSTLGG